MFRFTIRDVLWLIIAVAMSTGVAAASFRLGVEFGQAGNKVQLSEAEYHLAIARACLKKHGLPMRCEDESTDASPTANKPPQSPK